MTENAMAQSDAWDWPVLLYVGTVFLQRTEREFWHMTPRKLTILSQVHVEMDSMKNARQEEQKFIDQIF